MIACRPYVVLAVAIAAALTCAPASAFAAAPPQPRALQVGQTSVTLGWTKVAGAARYVVLRNGAVVGSTRAGTSLQVRDLRPAAASTYMVIARRASGETISSTQPAIIATHAPSTCTRVVSASGSDGAAGTAAAPWRTIAKLMSVWQPGWVGCIRGSIAEDVTIARGGTLTQPVVLRSEPGARATLLGRVVIQRGADNVVLTELNLDGRALNGAGREDLPSPTINGNGALLLRNDISNRRSRICIVVGSIRGWGRARNTAIVGNRIHDCGARDANDNGNNHHHGIYVEGADRTRIASNVIYQNADRGIQLFPDADDSLIVGNVLDGNGEGLIFSGAEGRTSSRNRVIGNVASNSRTRYDIEYYWDPSSPVGTGNIARGNCVGGGRWGGLALPAIGYVPRGNVTGPPSYRARMSGDLRPLPGSRCSGWLRSAQLPLTAFRAA